MCLTAMMRLVVEKVLEDICDPLLVWLTAGRLIAMRPIQVAIAIGFDHGNQALVFPGTGTCQFIPIVMDDGIEPIGVFTLTRQTTEPEPICDEQVIERPVKAPEENADRTPIRFVWQS
jgi:hypothetical protein